MIILEDQQDGRNAPKKPILKIGTRQMEVRHLANGRKLLVLPDGKLNGYAWYEILPEQAKWLSEELSK
jgi:hypothetical protein